MSTPYDYLKDDAYNSIRGDDLGTMDEMERSRGPDTGGASNRARRRKLYVAFGAVVVALVILVAILASPPMKGVIGQIYLHNGDFIEYNATGAAMFLPLTGKVRIDISNVSISGFTATVNSSGIPLMDSQVIECSWDDDMMEFLPLGTKVGAVEVSTPWGVKAVDKYYTENGTAKVTSYVGIDPRIIYRAEIVAPLYVMAVDIVDTNIDVVKNSNQ